jgi:hypothetical protein
VKTNLLFLLVPLACPTFGIAASAPPPPSLVPVWQQSPGTNAVDDFAYSRFTLMGTFVTPSHDAMHNRPAFVVDCIPADESVATRTQ